MNTGRWLLLLVTTSAMLWLMQLMLRERDLVVRYNDARDEAESLLRLESRTAQLNVDTWRCVEDHQRARTELFELLADCNSREDFLVREGPWIVASRLKCSPPDLTRVGVYLPKGSYLLKVAAQHPVERSRGGKLNLGTFLTQESEGSPIVHTIGIANTPEVFELQVSQINVSALQLRVLGQQNSILLQWQFALPDDTQKCEASETDGLPSLAYPNELTVEDLTRPRSKVESPKTELLDLTCRGSRTSGGRVRVWIEADAPLCIAALEVARRFDAIANPDQLPRNTASSKFSQLFQPYTGTGRYHLQPRR